LDVTRAGEQTVNDEPKPNGHTTARRTLAAGDGRDAPPRVSSRELLGGRTELRIEHGGEEYRLRLTRQNKLILTK
jgi:hemin uptake protein HemP